MCHVLHQQNEKKNKKKSNHHFFSTINLPIAKICQRAQRATNVPQGGKTPETHQGRSLAPWLKHTGPRSVLSGARIMKQPGRSSTLVGGGGGGGREVIDLTA